MKDDFKYMLSNWIKWDKKSLLFFFIRVPALVFQPIVTAYIPKAIIDCIEKGVTVQRLTLVIALLSLLLTMTIWLDPFMQELVRGGARIVRMRYAVMAFRKSLSTDYANIESLEGREIQKRAEDFYNARFSGSADFIEELNSILVSIVGVITASVLLYKINFLIILLIVLTCVAEFFLLKFLNSREKQTRDETSKLVTKFDYFYNLSKNFEASKDIKIYGFGDYFIIAIAKIIAGIENVIAKYTKRSASVNGVRALLNTVRQFIAWVYLIYLVSNNRLSVSDFVFYFGIITGFSDWVIRLVLGYSWIERCCNDCNAFRKFVESDEQGINKPDVNFDNVETLEFKNVSFSYQGSDNMTIKNMSFKINNGENLAVVGRNGSGKTTFIKLLCRLYDVTDGEILINGINIKEYTKNSLLKLYSVVFQDFKIFSTTIAQNISASEKYDSNKLYDALDKANIRDRVMAMENKERTYLYKNIDKSGVEISGGEAQKLALARALYKNAPVVILDEPTAALDPIAENEIYSRFNSFVKGKTAIYISHRLSSCAFCDNIAVFDNAQLVEFGTHNDLLNANGKYSQLWTAQAKYYV